MNARQNSGTRVAGLQHILMVAGLVLFCLASPRALAGGITGWVTPETNYNVPLHAMIWLGVHDEANPPGLVQMRVKLPNSQYWPWTQYYPHFPLRFTAGGKQTISVQLKNVSGVVYEFSAQLDVAGPGPIYVDQKAVAPFWGTREHPCAAIGEAMVLSSTGCEVVVAPGMYDETFIGVDDVVVRSLDPNDPEVVKSTILRGVRFGGTESGHCVLSGFVIAGCRSHGISGNGTHATIQNNYIVGNTAPVDKTEYSWTGSIPYGGGWYTSYYITYISQGGGLIDCHGTIQNNIIANNYLGAPPTPPVITPPSILSLSYDYHGTALYNCDGIIRHNLIQNNLNERALSFIAECNGTIENNIVWGNSPGTWYHCSTPLYCDIQGWDTAVGTHNISEDPLLDPAGNGLLSDSPCIDAGCLITFEPAPDMVGIPRGVVGYNGPRGDGSHFDIGPFEYTTQPLPVSTPAILPESGLYPFAPITVSMTCPTLNATIRYTLDGADPTPQSAVYSSPFTVLPSPSRLTVKARAFRADRSPSTVTSQTYTCLAPLALYVSAANTAGPWLGTMAKPFKSISSAMAVAGWGTTIHVQPGGYDAVVMKSGVRLVGGYPPGSWDPLKRNPGYTKLTQRTSKIWYGTTLLAMDSVTSASVDGFVICRPDVAAVNPCGVYFRKVGKNCRIQNCVISDIPTTYSTASALAPWGAGIVCDQASPNIVHCTIERNRGRLGAGIYLSGNCAPFIDGCVIRNNSVVAGTVPPVGFDGCGGGIFCDNGARPYIQNCVFYGNSAPIKGSGIFGSTGWIVNCTFYNNDLVNCTGPIRNCIAWGAAGLLSNCSVPAYSCIQGWTGTSYGNLGVDPKFSSPSTGNFRLRGESPVIDAGMRVAGVNTDIEGVPRGAIASTGRRGDGNHVDMGAYELAVATPDIQPLSGSLASPVLVTISCATPGAVIRYTAGTAGVTPTAASKIYTGPFWIAAPVTVQARAWSGGYVSSVGYRTYTLKPLVISNISRAGVTTDTLDVGKLVNAGRSIRFTEVPNAFRYRTYLKTLDGDRAGGVGLKFMVSKAAVVYVAMSDGFGSAKPSWLNDWTLLSDKLVTSDPSAPGRKIYRKNFAAGQVSLGPNREGTMPNGPGMYSVIVAPQ